MEQAMTLYERIETEYIKAYKAHENEKVGVLRLLKSAVKNRLVELKRPGGALTDQEMIDVILKQAKQRMDSIEQYEAAGRSDLAAKEAAELELLREWLPKQLSQEELKEVIHKIITATGATAPKDMGKVMKELSANYAGKFDGKAASSLVREMLSR